MVSGSAAHCSKRWNQWGVTRHWARSAGVFSRGGARAAKGVDAFGDHLQAADVDAVDDTHAGGAELGVQVAEDLVQGRRAAAVVSEVIDGRHGVGANEYAGTAGIRAGGEVAHCRGEGV